MVKATTGRNTQIVHSCARPSALAGSDAMLHQSQIGQERQGSVGRGQIGRGPSPQVSLDRFEDWFIRRKARQLVGRCGFVASDFHDIAQDLRLDVLRRLARFDGSKSKRHTFVAMVVRRCVASMLERRRAEKRNNRRRVRSLNEPIHDPAGNEVELWATLDLGADIRRTVSDDGSDRDLEHRDLVIDVQRVVASLPDDLRSWCSVLGELGIREASRVLGFPRSRLCRIVDQIRAAFEQAGLGEYLAPA